MNKANQYDKIEKKLFKEKNMTKKKCLGYSSILNLCVLLFMGFSVMQIKSAIDAGEAIKGIGALASAYPIEGVLNTFGGVAMFAFVAFVAKVFAEGREKNGFTVLVLTFDIALLSFFLVLAKDLLLTGQIFANPFAIVPIALCALVILLDLLSFVVEYWNYFA